MNGEESGAVAARVENLDTDLFAAIPSQTSPRDRRSLLAVQRATARRFGTYAYLEIGSHLGGSIQTHLLDARCTAITSIDSRPASQPDERAPGCVVDYADNSTQRMLDLLGRLAPGQILKVRCFDAEAAAVDPVRIAPRPHLAFIDGEHTRRAVLSDFAFCQEVIAPGGTILFDDFPIVYPAVLEIVRSLRRAGLSLVTARLEGKAFGVFFDQELVRSDAFLRRCRDRSRFTLARYRIKLRTKSFLPGARGRAARDALRG